MEKDLEKSLYWTKRAAEHGDRDGQFNLGWMYENGLGVGLDVKEALFWYEKAAAQEHDLAKEKLAELN